MHSKSQCRAMKWMAWLALTTGKFLFIESCMHVTGSNEPVVQLTKPFLMCNQNFSYLRKADEISGVCNIEN